MNPNQDTVDLTRRDFLKGSSFAGLMTMLGAVEIKAQDKPKPAEDSGPEKGTAVKCGVIGCGAWGRELIKSLSIHPKAQVAGICDSYPAAMRRAQESAPKAEKFEDYRKLLDQKEIPAVFIATPSYQHREIAVAALKAGKHVYCESPLATTVEDARAIAAAAKAATKQVFQSGQQLRADTQRHFLLSFIRTGAWGKTIKARGQWHKKQTWRRAAPTPEREKTLNWRLYKDTSIGLIGEIGLFQIDMANWFINERPLAVTGFGGILTLNDGRDVPDSVTAVFEYPNDVLLVYECTLANSFDAEYEMYYGTDAALMIRDNRAWMFKEVDSPLLGWEVYARKDTFYKETGIALVANATKLAAIAQKATEGSVDETDTPLYHAIDAFLTNADLMTAAVEDFSTNFDASDAKALEEYLASNVRKSMKPTAGYKEGLEATVTVIRANEAILKKQRLTFDKALFDV